MESLNPSSQKSSRRLKLLGTAYEIALPPSHLSRRRCAAGLARQLVYHGLGATTPEGHQLYHESALDRAPEYRLKAAIEREGLAIVRPPAILQQVDEECRRMRHLFNVDWATALYDVVLNIERRA
jgi:hypothetical protein